MSIPYGKEYDDDGFPVDSLLKSLFNGAWLDAQTFPELEEIVPGILVEGFAILVGPPKVGKSWLVGNLGIACAAGGMALGAIPVKQRPVLYLALEDGPRRLQSRLQLLTEGDPLPPGLDMLCQIEPGMVTATIAEWLVRHECSSPLVILDTLGKARPQRRAGEDPYLADYKVGGQLKKLVDDTPGSALLVVHHTNKGESGDFVDAVSGTQGIAGSADSVIVLRRQRKSEEATLAITGRDIVEREIGLRTSEGRWSLDGLDLAAAERAVEDRGNDQALGDQTLAVLKFVNENTAEVGAKSVAANVVGVSEHAARTILGRLVDYGQITKTGRGKYQSSVASVANSNSSGAGVTSANDENATNATNITPLFE